MHAVMTNIAVTAINAYLKVILFILKCLWSLDLKAAIVIPTRNDANERNLDII